MADAPARVVLDGVPRVGFYFDQQKHDDSKMRCPEDVPLPSCLRACSSRSATPRQPGSPASSRPSPVFDSAKQRCHDG
ncbi:hypothetical protein HQ576_00310 [bacterium]|nr:hypothetical protein [bacterium]